MPLRVSIVRVVFGAFLILPCGGTGHAFELISQEEASRPNDPTETKGISRGPRVTPISPAPTAGFIKSPFNWRVKFEAFGGAQIDKDTVVITYRKSPPPDLSQRLAPYIQASGINLDGVQVPPGEHRIRIDVKDTNGRAGWAELTIKVAN